MSHSLDNIPRWYDHKRKGKFAKCRDILSPQYDTVILRILAFSFIWKHIQKECDFSCLLQLDLTIIHIWQGCRFKSNLIRGAHTNLTSLILIRSKRCHQLCHKEMQTWQGTRVQKWNQTILKTILIPWLAHLQIYKEADENLKTNIKE